MPARDPFPWFCLWHRVLNEHKVQSLPDRTFKHWINILCLASRQKRRGTLPPVAELAFHLRTSQCDAEAVTEELISRRLLDRDGDRVVVHDWADYQPKSDSSTERTRKYRERLRQSGRAPSRDVTVTKTVTSRDATVTGLELEGEGEKDTLLPVSSTSLGGPAGVDGGAGRADLDAWARQTLGDRFDLENLGPNLAAWSLAYPRDWIRLAVESAVRARPGGLAAYAHRILARSHAAGRCVVADTLAPPPPAGTNGTGHVSKSQAAVDNWTRYLETKEQGKEAHDAPG